jgi:hypothetical protein
MVMLFGLTNAPATF